MFLMSPELEYAAFHLIKSCGGYCEKNRFYKLMYLLDDELIELDYGLDIPYYWYRDGIVVEGAEHLLALRERDLFDIVPQDEKNTINKAIEKLLKKNKFETTDKINAEIYKNAPFPFQNEFRKLLITVESWKERRTLDNYFDCGDSDTLNLLKRLLKTFPQNEFKEIYPLFLEWENYTEYMIKNNQSRVEISLLVEKFSFLFAKKLRILVNENINAKTVVHWQLDYEKSLKDFEKYLFDFSREFYTKYYKTPETKSKHLKELDELSSKVIRE